MISTAYIVSGLTGCFAAFYVAKPLFLSFDCAAYLSVGTRPHYSCGYVIHLFQSWLIAAI